MPVPAYVYGNSYGDVQDRAMNYDRARDQRYQSSLASILQAQQMRQAALNAEASRRDQAVQSGNQSGLSLASLFANQRNAADNLALNTRQLDESGLARLFNQGLQERQLGLSERNTAWHEGNAQAQAETNQKLLDTQLADREQEINEKKRAASSLAMAMNRLREMSGTGLEDVEAKVKPGFWGSIADLIYEPDSQVKQLQKQIPQINDYLTDDEIAGAKNRSDLAKLMASAQKKQAADTATLEQFVEGYLKGGYGSLVTPDASGRYRSVFEEPTRTAPPLQMIRPFAPDPGGGGIMPGSRRRHRTTGVIEVFDGRAWVPM